MGNNRGTRWGLRHVKLNVKDKAFWSFTWEEMGTKDLPAFINYILKMTGQDKLSYMGHSEGTTQLLAGGSMLPEFFNSRIAVAILLAPPASMVYSSMRGKSSKSMVDMMGGVIKTFKMTKMGNAGVYNFEHYA
jgi:pimeloyl-ACP methyl ester carboxylesterase